MAKIDEIKMLRLGQRDENLARSLTFDCSDWLEQYPEASIHILFRRPGESAIVPMSTTLEGTTLTWLIHDFEVGKTGVGNAEFRAVDTAGLRRKSRIIPCSIEETLLGDDETVLYTQDQVDETLAHISEAAQSAQAAKASEEAAALSAQNAAESETSASAAASVATSARDAAQAAQTAAETAQRQAEAAQSGVHADAEAAEQAKVAAQAAQASAQRAASQASADRTAAETARADAEAAATHAEAVVEGIDQAGADQVAAVSAAGQAQVTAVNQAGTTQVGNVNTAGTTQVNAVQAKGAQVIDSIPADYSALTDDVTGLKSALKPLTGAEIIQFTDGKYIATNGDTADITTLVTYASMRCAAVPCSEGDQFVINARGGAVGKTWAFLGAITTGNARTVLDRATNNSAVENLTLTAPENATYLVVNDQDKTGDCFYGVPILAQFGGIEDSIAALEDEADNLNDRFDDAINVSYTGNIARGDITDTHTGKYYYRTQSGLLDESNGPNYNDFKIILECSPNANFIANAYTYVVLLDENGSPLPTGATPWDYNKVKTFNSGIAKRLAVSFDHRNISQYILSQGNTLEDSVPVLVYTTNGEKHLPKQYTKKAEAIASGGALSISGRSAIKDGETIVFNSRISAFSSLRLNFVGGSSVNYVDVNETRVEIKNTAAAAISFDHGLTIANDLSIVATFNKGKLDISVCSNGGLFRQTDIVWYQTGATMTEPQIVSTGTTCTDATLEVVYGCIDRPIWYFGDSYINFNLDTRIPALLKLYGLESVMLMSGADGCSSPSTVTAFETLLQFGLPKFAVFATGMNDGSDGETIPTNYTKYVENFLNYCEMYGITPILCTIPTVPNVNNELKNAYVRSSGYRYIDYAKAVGADANGHWFGYNTDHNMLSNDNVHPSEAGARALFCKLLVDLPEILENAK